jgi:Sulfatase
MVRMARPFALPSIQPHHVIWIVFDELSQQQTYEHRFPGLQLPAFDALAQQATVFTQAKPPNIYTRIVLPGLLAGKPFDQIRTSSSGELFTHDPRTDKWQPFNQYDTVFQDARNAKYTTAVAGWYNPYCRIVPHVLDQCTWTFRDHKANGMVGSESIAYNSLSAMHFFACMALTALPNRIFRAPLGCRRFFFDTQPLPLSHARDYQELYRASLELLGNRTYDFTFLHLPIPHPGGIYDRSTGQITAAPSSTYIDNLALTDTCLAGLRAMLEQTGQWNSSTVVVMGDHSWRTTNLWIPSTLWSDEEQEASLGGTYDPRPVFIVKLPGQTVGSRVDAPFATVDTRKLFDALMAHQIQTPTDLTTWVQSHH